jgi:hypothetical protein
VLVISSGENIEIRYKDGERQWLETTGEYAGEYDGKYLVRGENVQLWMNYKGNGKHEMAIARMEAFEGEW